eukprot:9239-Heterococcus_DN1.PRE.1
MPLAFTARSRMALASGMASGNLGTKMLPTAYLPASGRGDTPASAATLRMKASGMATSMPAPSPVFSSQPQAPLWVMRTSISLASTTMLREALDLSCTHRPTPQESFSRAGSYRPLRPVGKARTLPLGFCAALVAAFVLSCL